MPTTLRGILNVIAEAELPFGSCFIFCVDQPTSNGLPPMVFKEDDEEEEEEAVCGQLFTVLAFRFISPVICWTT